MLERIQVKVEELNSLVPTKIVEHKDVERKFVQMYDAIWGSRMGRQIYEKEVFNFQKVLRENPSVAECSKMSLYGCFLDMAVNGLSLDNTSHPHCYLIPRNVKTGHKDANNRDIYEKRANVSVTGYGELTMRMRCGQIKYADNPVVIYEGDIFSVGLDNGVKKITYSAKIPRISTKVIGAFIRIVRTDGSEDYQWLLEGDIQRLANYSARSNDYWKDGQKIQGKANALYTSNLSGIDPGFLENKMIKHAFDAYPKVRTGQFTIMETIEEEPTAIDYGIAEEINQEQEVITPFGPEEPETVPPTITPEVTQADEEDGF
ncbi:recombinase RecT [uncultured Bacteroides sp.]|uniref:recombinase RecT n=1 Tax=uncultured Bacteroides sp. TaxID=162156 RepID=UPI002AA8F38C|nr:recombinase RecT [uncultured Bacteroides sp.]